MSFASEMTWRKRLIAVLLLLWAYLALPISHALAAATVFPAPNGGPERLVVYSSLDLNVARPLIEGFQAERPDVGVTYHEMQTLEIYERVLVESDGGDKTADLVISSAMDLQMKLANDGYAQTLNLPQAAAWPQWAKWRDTAFALTFEPSVIIYHKPSFAELDVPQTRAALQALLSEQSDALYGRVATYDIERAGVGFLFLARDAEHDRDVWSLVQSMGEAGVKLYSNSSSILERVSDGRFALGYNILGPYAQAWAANNPDLGIVLPSDYTLIMSRIAIVPQAAEQPSLATDLLGYFLSRDGQQIMAERSRLPALHPEVSGENTAARLRRDMGSQLRPIAVSPALLVYLDQVKRARFLQRWNRALRGQ